MKKILLFLIIAGTSACTIAQQTHQQKIDSVSQLVRQYFNDKNSNALYSLAGEDFRKALSPQQFKAVCENNLYPLGNMNDLSYETDENGVSLFKASFKSAALTMGISLDGDDKLQAFYFKPYVNKKEKKDYTVPSSNPMKTDLDKEVDSDLRPYTELKATAGLSIGIIKDNKEFFYSYGETARGTKQLPDEHTIYEIGSITKTFTATLLANAADHGLLELDDPLNKYLPDSIPALSYEGQPLTLKTMADHSSGLPRMPGNFHSSMMDNPYTDYDRTDLYDFYKNFKPFRKPGDEYEYSNLAFGTLGVVLSGLYHEDYATLVKKLITEPLKMKETMIVIPAKDSARFAKGYNSDGSYNPPWEFKAMAGAGSIRSTVSDLLIYAKANWGKGPADLEKAIDLTHQVTFDKGQMKVGLAWHYMNPGGGEVLFHNGETGGYHAFLVIDTHRKISLVILSNCALGTEEYGYRLMKWMQQHN